jgi:hypothetical protein
VTDRIKGRYKKGHALTPKIKLPIDKIMNLYIVEKKSMEQIAKLYSVGTSTIKRRLIKENITIRDTSNAMKNAIKMGRRNVLINGHGPNWKGGKKYRYGYVEIYMPKHPSSQCGYIKEHRLVMEKQIGRYLKSYELVHHKNGIKDDNRPDNLIIVIRKKHYGEICCPFCEKLFFIK